MSIEKIRSVHTEGYGQLDMRTIKDTRLTNAELGLLLRLISLPENWQFSAKGMKAAYPKNGVTSVNTSIKGLREKGYVINVGQIKNDRGKYGETHMVVYELSQKPDAENEESVNPCTENPSAENPCSEDLSTEKLCSEDP